ncbi:phosphoribosylformylglycinamidine synthase II [Oenococcus oeni]|uniref:phosphoribosylformylglycinamidine synthase subunit PurL n=1 Tax=Oenococcus oeni TaxID=1247 RepID=UPI0008F86AAC|nr:phosphoribosylformylglycinamidine synthase subunit PurL [Oenococcus oeni]OIL69081.1 phosphoribosylformylglycinamidine synthase II [Oenococcus oeni]OIM47972.1 phosphoribosylformylglycinamidine synthase II [Oenococcus oeni]OLQ33531.1 phosphoribosylformylglycinamidine synthase II [Oenococcus oeni]
MSIAANPQLKSAEEVKSERIYAQWGLTDQEFKIIENEMGRLPNYTETGLFSAMWSEHASYKKSKPILKTFWSKNERVLQGPGEGAGILDIGDGQAVVFKAESHNHPSQVEPYQGAATGVGGILRDIFSMGAQPIAVLDSLRFSEIKNEQTKSLIDGVIDGIAGYGNAIGIPTVGGDVAFDDAYEGNLLCNVMSIGLLDHQDTIKVGQAHGKDNSVIYVGAKTGRDGINGATFASTEFSSQEESQRSAVQVGDPFMEKLVMDATIKAVREMPEAVIAIQDMGAAGILSSSSEMGEKGGSGIWLDLDKVPVREKGMIPYELMLSESQERMLLVVAQGREKGVIDLYRDAGLDAVVIGKVTDDSRYRLSFQGETVADLDIKLLTKAPSYKLPSKLPVHIKKASQQQYQPKISNPLQIIMQILSQPTISSKKFFYRHFDSMVRTDTVVKPGGDAAVIRIRGTKKALSLTTDVNGRYVYLDPYRGGQMAIAEAARNVVSTGALPIGITDCLNFGNPDNQEVYYELEQSVAGINNFAKQLNTPVVSGNVSLYNETDNRAIYPTPMIGMVGLIRDNRKITTINFKKNGDLIYLIGSTGNDFNGSEIQKLQTGKISGKLFDFDADAELNNQKLILTAIEAGLLKSAHDLSEGGLIVALLESAFETSFAFDANLKLDDAQLFAETNGRFIVTVEQEKEPVFEKMAGDQAELIGRVTDRNHFQIKTDQSSFSIDKEEATKTWKNSIANLME